MFIRRQSRSPARPCTACFREALRLSRSISRHKTLRKKTRKIYSTIPLTGLVLLVNRLCRSRGAERNSRHSVIGKAIIQAGNASLLFNRASLLRGQPRTPASPQRAERVLRREIIEKMMFLRFNKFPERFTAPGVVHRRYISFLRFGFFIVRIKIF